MSDFDNAKRDAADLAKLVNEDVDVTTRYGTNPKISAPKAIRQIGEDGATAVSEILQDGDTAVGQILQKGDDAIRSYNITPAFDFANGFTIETRNQAGIDANGDYWIYNGTLPFTVAAGAVPSEPEYTNIIFSAITDSSIWGDRYVGTFASGFTYTRDTDVARGQDGKYYRYIGNASYPVTVAGGTVAGDFSGLYGATEPVILQVDTIAGLQGLTGTEGQQVSVASYHGLDDLSGGGTFVWSTGRHNGGTFIDPARAFPTDWNDQAQLEAWFTDSSSDVVGLKRVYDGAVNVKWFGAIGNWDSDAQVGTDDTVSILAARDYAQANERKLTGGGYGKSLVTKTIHFIESIDFSNYSVYAASAVSPVLLIGSDDENTQTVSKEYRLPAIRCVDKPTNGWITGSVGVRYANLYSCVTYTPRVGGFEVGEWFGGTRGHAYNEHHHTMPFGNKMNVLLEAVGVNGWVNENNFYGGRYGHNSNDATDWVGTRNIKLSKLSAGTNAAPNNNLFIKPSVESNSIEFMLDIQGSYNRFLNGRYEGTNCFVRLYSAVTSECSSNVIDGGYQSANIQFTFDGEISPYNSIIGRQNRKFDTTGMFQAVKNQGGDSLPHYVGYSTTKDSALNAATTDTDWKYKLSANRFEMKGSDDKSATLVLSSGKIAFGSGGADADKWFRSYSNLIRVNSTLVDENDNTHDLGSANNRWSVIYSASGTINTSDDREKLYLTIDEKERLVAQELKGLIKKFKFSYAIETKGLDNARIHFGASAQTVKTTFEKHGLEAENYAMLCYDEWGETPEELDGEGNTIEKYRPAGNRYGIRYEELLSFIISAI